MKPKQYDSHLALNCKIFVRGRHGKELLPALPQLQPEVRGDYTVLRTVIADQAVLNAVLHQIEALGLEPLALQLPPCIRDKPLQIKAD